MRHRSWKVWLGAGAFAIASAGAALWLHESHIAQVADRESIALHSARPITPDSQRVEAALVDLHALLEVCGSDYDTYGAPWKWTLEFDAALRNELDWSAPFFAEIDALVADPAFQRVLRDGARLPEGPSRFRARIYTNLLCARAVVDARDGRSEDSARRLAQALDLTHVQFGPFSASDMIVTATDVIVLQACRSILATSDVDPSVVGRELIPRLERARETDRFVQCSRGDAVGWLKAEYADADLGEWSFRWRLRRNALDRLEGRTSDDSSLIPVVATLFPSRAPSACQENAFRMTVAEVALEVSAHKREHGAWPTRLAEVLDADAEARANAAGVSWTIHGDEAHLLAAATSKSNGLAEWTLR